MSSGLLTRKQAWRRQFKNSSRSKTHDVLFNESSRTADDELPVRSSSAPTVSSLIEYALSNTKQWGTTGNLKENVSTRIKKKMGVRFDSTLRVVLIPSRKDYDVSHLSDALWWNEDDYKTFREAAFFELENLLRSEIKIESKREALDIMYQPHENEIYGNDDDNFFLYYDDKSGFLFPITLLGSCSSQLNEMSNNNDTNNNTNINKNNNNNNNNNKSNSNNNNNNTNSTKVNNDKIDVYEKNINIFNNINTSNNNNNNNNNANNKCNTHTAVDLFGKVIPSKSHDIFNRKASANAVLNIQGFDQITKSEVRKRDDDKIKEKEKDLNYQDQLRVHPLATICG